MLHQKTKIRKARKIWYTLPIWKPGLYPLFGGLETQSPSMIIKWSLLYHPWLFIPWSGNKWCYFLGYIDRSTITRLRAESEDDVVFMSSSYALCQTRVSVLSYWVYRWRCIGGKKAPHQTMGYSSINYITQMSTHVSHSHTDTQNLKKHSFRTELSAGFSSDDHNHPSKLNEPTIARIRKCDQYKIPFISDYFLKSKDG